MASQEWSEPLLPIGQIHPSDEQAIRLILPIMTSLESQLICSLAAVLAFSASSCREGPATAETERTATAQGVDPDALAVPQQAVRHNETGGSEVFGSAKTTAPALLRSASAERWGSLAHSRWCEAG